MVDTAGVDPDATLLLLREILHGLPRLPDASCTGKRALFDPVPGRGPEHHEQEHARIARAAACCAGCPARAKCPTVTSSTTIGLAIGVRRASTRVVRTSIPPPPGTLPLAQ